MTPGGECVQGEDVLRSCDHCRSVSFSVTTTALTVTTDSLTVLATVLDCMQASCRKAMIDGSA